MFDWNDEELTNIIWGEAEEGEDHIVPHPDANHSDILRNHTKNETNKERVDPKLKELTKSILQNPSHCIKDESSSPDGNALDRTRNSLPRLEKVHDLECTQTYNSIHEPTSEVETAASEIFQCPVEENEQSDFVDDYGWASVGSFEDLDRIFSNEDPIHGNVSLGITEDLWTSCRDDPPNLGSSPLLRNKTEQFDVEADFLSNEYLSFNACNGKFSSPQDRNWLNINAGSSDGETNVSKEKENEQKKLLKSRKRVIEDCNFHGHENQYIESQSPYAPSSSLGFTQPIVNGNVSNYYYAPLPSSLSPFHTMGVSLQPHEMPYYRSLSMTPQEKIEKLRRRQQMRAMLAIQEQHQQFSSVETEQNPPIFDLNSPVQQDYSNQTSMVLDESSVMDSMLYQFQDTIAKLDMQVRLSMRDSLFRLANSAGQRRYANNAKQDSNIHIRFPETCNVETETNSIDRTVAKLLFYPGKLVEAKSTSLMSHPRDIFEQKSKSKQIYYHDNKSEV